MPISADTLRLHLDYSFWASQRLLDAALNLTPQHTPRDYEPADGNVLGTLAHVFAGDRAWIARLEDNPRKTLLDPDDRNLATLQREWPVVQQRWKQWAAALSDEGVSARLAYVDFRGNSWEQPGWQIVLHVVHHVTHHHVHTPTFLPSIAYTPPPLH